MKKAAIITYGCQMNVNESAKIKKYFKIWDTKFKMNLLDVISYF